MLTLCAVEGEVHYMNCKTIIYYVFSDFNRALDGVADAAAFGSMTSILMAHFPDSVATVVSYSHCLFLLGYTIGK